MSEILNPEVCEGCATEWTAEGEWVMDTHACPDNKGYCLNCCGCPDHAGEPWY